MATLIPRMSYPELFFGFVAPVGVDLRGCIDSLKINLSTMGYQCVELKVTDIFERLSAHIKPDEELSLETETRRYKSYIKYGNQLRAFFKDDAALAVLTVARLARWRQLNGPLSGENKERYSKTAFILHQFKRKEEIDFLRSIYGQQFFQMSVYSRRGTRVDFLSARFANTSNSANRNSFRARAEEIVQIDYNEAANESGDHGQKVVKIFHDGDFIINIDKGKENVTQQIRRCVELIFGANDISPTKLEYAMYIAKAAALRSLDLSRQVGAAIFSQGGEVVSLGCNEVPKAGGGTYWCDDGVDDRECVRGEDTNERRKREVIMELLGAVDAINRLNDERVQESQFMDALEYGRIIHAEMSAIVDAARSGRSTRGTKLFCTTFPCHMCAKHIVAAGIETVYFLEPYPKSLVGDLHCDSVCVEGNDRGFYSQHPSVQFEHFYGVSPRRYRELFERTSRKDVDGRFRKWKGDFPCPNLIVNEVSYGRFEERLMDSVIKEYFNAIQIDTSTFEP